jgi:hypothetical protein
MRVRPCEADYQEERIFAGRNWFAFDFESLCWVSFLVEVRGRVLTVVAQSILLHHIQSSRYVLNTAEIRLTLKPSHRRNQGALDERQRQTTERSRRLRS